MAGRSKNAGRRLLVLKNNRWWFRREIPEAIRRGIGRGRFWMVNLNTGDLHTAQRLRDELERETAETFEQVRAGKSLAAVTLPAREQGILYREQIAAVADQQPDGPEEVSPYDTIVWAAESVADSYRSEEEREAFLSALHGQEPVDAHIDEHLASLSVTPDSRSERAGLIRKFAVWAAAQKPVALTVDRIDRRQAGKYVSEKLDALHPKTQAKHLMALRGYWSFLAARGIIDLPPNEQRGSGWPWNGQQVRSKAVRAERGGRSEERAFTEDEVRTLLYAPEPDGMRPAHLPAIRDALRISLLSGMRMAEVLTLWVEEVREVPGAGLVFDIQQGKTEAAARRVPVHPDLVGILARRMKDREGEDKPGKAWLFDELARERDPGDTFSKRFARFRKHLGVDDVRPGHRRSLVNFHSARRWFVTSARHAGQPKETIADVVGHVPDKKDITFGTYTKGASPAQMRECVEAVRLPAHCSGTSLVPLPAA